MVVASLVASLQIAFGTTFSLSIGQLTTCAGILPGLADATKTTTAVLVYLSQFPWYFDSSWKALPWPTATNCPQATDVVAGAFPRPIIQSFLALPSPGLAAVIADDTVKIKYLVWKK